MSRAQRTLNGALALGYVVLCLESWILALHATSFPAFAFCGLFLVVGAVMLYRLSSPAWRPRRALGSWGALW